MEDKIYSLGAGCPETFPSSLMGDPSTALAERSSDVNLGSSIACVTFNRRMRENEDFGGKFKPGERGNAYLDFARCLCLADVVGADGGVGTSVGHGGLLDDQRGAAARVLRHQHALPHL